MTVYLNRATNSPDNWIQARAVYVKSVTGWKLGKEIRAKTGSITWSMREVLDVSAPGIPTLLNITTNSASRKVTVTARMPLDADLNHATLKYSSSRYPPDEHGALHTYSGDGLENRQSVTPGGTVTWTWTPGRYDVPYYVSIWAVDHYGNASDRRRTQFKVKAPVVAPPPPAPKPVKATYNASSSGTRERAGTWAGNWSAWAGNLVIQAGEPNFAGGWFYGAKIKNLLSNKSKINKMTIRIQRVNSQHGVSAGANIYLVPYRIQAAGTAKTKTPALNAAATPVLVGTLTRGQAKTFNVPSAWWPRFVSGDYVSLGLWTPSTSGTPWTSPNYVQAYGKGTTSGQVYIEAV